MQFPLVLLQMDCHFSPENTFYYISSLIRFLTNKKKKREKYIPHPFFVINSLDWWDINTRLGFLEKIELPQLINPKRTNVLRTGSSIFDFILFRQNTILLLDHITEHLYIYIHIYTYIVQITRSNSLTFFSTFVYIKKK